MNIEIRTSSDEVLENLRYDQEEQFAEELIDTISEEHLFEALKEKYTNIQILENSEIGLDAINEYLNERGCKVVNND